MRLKVIPLILWGFVIGSALTSLVLYGSDNIFLVDKFAKRVSYAIAIVVVLVGLVKQGYRFEKVQGFIAFFCFFILVPFFIGIINEVPRTYLITELVQVFFILAMYYFSTKSKIWEIQPVAYFKVFIAAAFVACLGVKLQLSYSGFLLSWLLIFGYRPKSIVSMLALTAISVYAVFLSLAGKSAILSLILSIVVIFNYRFLANARIYGLLAFLSISVALIYVIFPELILGSGAFQKTSLFFRSVDLESGVFDVSTTQRIFESEVVLEKLSSSNTFFSIFGHGLGANVDLSGTSDSAVVNSHENLTEVRNIHFLFFYLLLKFGALGVFFFYMAMMFHFVKVRKIFFCLKSHKQNDSTLLLKCLGFYSLFICFDGQVSAGHLMSNPLFFFSYFVILFTPLNKIKQLVK